MSSAAIALFAVFSVVSWGVGMSSSLHHIKTSVEEVKADVKEVRAGLRTTNILLIGTAGLLLPPTITKVGQSLGIFPKE